MFGENPAKAVEYYDSESKRAGQPPVLEALDRLSMLSDRLQKVAANLSEKTEIIAAPVPVSDGEIPGPNTGDRSKMVAMLEGLHQRMSRSVNLIEQTIGTLEI